MIAADRILWTRRLTAVFLLLLLGSTWRLWTPHNIVPTVPAAAVLAIAPDALHRGLFAVTIAGTAVWSLIERYSRAAASVVLVSLGLLLALDQLRWQPWALLAWVTIGVVAFVEPIRALRLLRWLMIGIYFHSALAKLDYEFVSTLGQQFSATLVGFAGVQFEALPEDLRFSLAIAFPVAELIVAGLLCFRQTVRTGAVAAVVMHLITISILGPWGLAHQPGVLIWNLWLAIQTPLLFWPTQVPAASEHAPVAPATLGNRVAAGLVVAAIVLPFWTRWGWWDTWPAWGLYAPGAERATVWVHELAIARLPPDIAQHVRGDEIWRQLQVDRRVLSELGAPLYPQNRVRLAVAQAIAKRHQLGDLLRVELHSPADRWTGERTSCLLANEREIASQLERYWLNALPEP